MPVEELILNSKQVNSLNKIILYCTVRTASYFDVHIDYSVYK